MDELDHVVRDFLVESQENLDAVDNQLVSLEESQRDPEVVAAIFRAIHTIKGTCGFLGFTRLEQLTHVGENLLSLLRDGAIPPDRAITDALLEMVDAIRQILARIENDGEEGPEEYASLKDRLEQLTRGGGPGVATPDSTASRPGAEPQPVSPAPIGEAAREPTTPEEPGTPSSPVSSPADPEPGTIRTGSIGQMLVQRGYISRTEVEAALLQQRGGDPRHIGEILVERGTLRPEHLVEVLRNQQESRGSIADNSIRVQVDLLDRLMNLVGELVLTRNQILQFQAESANAAFHATAQRLSLITTELQEGVMQTRMQPIGTVWDKFPRVVRDVAHATRKDVRVVMDGRDTELDKTIIEAIKDPLTHIIRNAVDHGIELPDVRKEQGKDPEGRLTLRAFHEGGQVNIEISDDGGGIDAARIRAKAIERGLLSADRASTLSNQELMQLIFAPGFSTAEKVTNVSGRGVGMDVVKTNIEKIGGTIDIHAQPGQGTTIRIKIPLTLAIIPALMIRCGSERFAIPQVSLVELVRVDPDQDTGRIEYVHGAPVYRLRGDLLPLVFLREALELREQGVELHGSATGVINIVVLQAEKQQFGLVVDEVTDTQEIVVKPLGKQLKSLECFAGATIMGDGRVALILDVQGIARQSGIHRDTSVAKAVALAQGQAAEDTGTDRLLIFSVGREDRMALPLSSVQRLEEFESSSVERAGHVRVVQYRGRLLPLVDLRERFGHTTGTSGERTQVIVYGGNDRSVGFVVQEIIDVVEDSVSIESCSKEPGIAGSAVIQGRVTDFLDPEEIASLSGAHAPAPAAVSG